MRFWTLICLAGVLQWNTLAAQEATRRIVPGISSTRHTEFSPTISADGRRLIYESDVDKLKGWELFESYLVNDSTWSTPVPLKSINEKCQFLAGPSLSYDGNTLFYTAFIEGQTKSEDIFYSERLADNAWSEPKSVGAPVNTDDAYEGFPSISADGHSLYFIRVNTENNYDKKNKEDCFKIFVSKQTEDGKWGTPEPLPANINNGCERDPKIMADNHTLIFSSIRDGGKGKYDLMQSRLGDDFTWSDPVYLDFINGGDNDQSPCISASGDVMFYYTQKDIYQVAIPSQYRQLINVTVQGLVKSEKTQQSLNVTIHVKEEDGPKEFTSESSAADGHYSLVLAAGKKYQVRFIHNTHVTESMSLDFTNQESYLEMRRDITMHSEYTLLLTIEDADLKKPLKAWLSVDGPGKPFSDTVQTERYPLTVTLPAGVDYKLTAAANGFPETTMPWTFSDSTTREMTYTFPLVHEKVVYVADVTHVKSGQKTKLKVYYSNETTGEVIVADAGEPVSLRKGDRYQVMTSSEKGSFFSTATVVADEKSAESGNVIDLIVVPVEVGQQLTLDYITFASNSADLTPTSFLELDRVAEFLQKNPTIEIEISAHTDDVGSLEYNLKLSDRRAQGAVTYLLKKGINKKNIKAVGHGHQKPAVPNDSEENRAKNRRVELRIIKIG
jgi:outer membrane protein OmpA-like peptidoglycan-associated protein